ncbi:tetratricopeptide repeat protein [Vibrio renipiscarius]|uniref:tetratricopeptide repeat protein n=1 Tax=Vibrio renipiscarius TaxID=1461322 RepID=UPI0009E41036|nr:tetratricopeptide repeat protein [Vibrio renipiscarius]
MLVQIKKLKPLFYVLAGFLFLFATSAAHALTENEATQILQQAELNNPRAQYQIAHAYQAGDSVTQSNKEAIYWLRQAASNRYKPAQRELIQHYQQGDLTEQNLNEALFWLTKLAMSGDDQAQFELGQFYELQAKHTEPLMQAKLWYQIAAQTNPKAETALTGLLEQEFNDQRAKQLAAMSDLNDSDNASLDDDKAITNPMPSWLYVLLFLVIIIVTAMALFWRRKQQARDSLPPAASTSTPNQADSDLRQKIARQDQALRKQKQQLEQLLSQLKAQQAASLRTQAKTEPQLHPLHLARSMFGYGDERLPDEKQIKQRYKQLCKIYHPDKQGSHEEMMRLNSALSIILKHVNK